ncbi:MAG: HAMP domain-containing sensor histidine kinase [Lachnospiraceae bacterium]|nr:HAMP domain-containing sensor histidine kinase [Lachnospiraceae bacterium]
MTIRKRLQISNILVTCISLFLALIISVVCIYAARQIITSVIDSENRYNRQMEPVRDQARELLEGVLDGEKKLSELESYLAEQNLWILLYNEDRTEVIASFGRNNQRNQRNGAVRDSDLSGSQKAVIAGRPDRSRAAEYETDAEGDGKTFPVTIYSWKSEDIDNTLIKICSVIICMMAIIISMLLTNGLMTRFVLNRIMEPLEILENGTMELGEGNLGYRIAYDNEDEFQSVCQNFNQMAQALQDSMTAVRQNEQSRKELLAGISHDLRSPLTSIKAYVEGLMDGVAVTSEMEKSYLEIIHVKTDEITGMVQKLFTFSKMDMDNYPCSIEQLHIHEELSEICRMFEEMGHLEIIAEQKEKNMSIMGDKLLFRNIIVNIFENAVKHNRSRDIRIFLEEKLIQENKENVVEIRISDDGTGVEKEQLEKIFEVFYRTDSARQNPGSGSGLGLAITAKAVEKMHGKIWAEQAMPHGLSVVIHFPAAKTEAISQMG